jgi:hypothetical protein
MPEFKNSKFICGESPFRSQAEAGKWKPYGRQSGNSFDPSFPSRKSNLNLIFTS